MAAAEARKYDTVLSVVIFYSECGCGSKLILFSESHSQLQ